MNQYFILLLFSIRYDTLLRGHPHGNVFLCKRKFCIVLADCSNGSCKRTFLKPGLRAKIFKKAALALVWMANFHILRIDRANYSVLHRLQWICLDANILETMPRKTGEKRIILVCVDMALGFKLALVTTGL